MKTIDSQEPPPEGVSGNPSAVGIKMPRARVVEGTDVIECLTEDPLCHWGFAFGDRMFCSHPSKNRIAEGNLFGDCQAIFSSP